MLETQARRVYGMCRAILGRPIGRSMQTFAPSNCFTHRGDKKLSPIRKRIARSTQTSKQIGNRQTKGHEKDIAALAVAKQ